MTPSLRYITLFVRLVVAAILLQTLFFKFSGAAESVAIFTRLGMEPWGRIGTGSVEAVAAALLLWPAPRVVVLGALLAAGVIAGALVSHVTVLGVEVAGDRGLLFGLALVVMAGSLFVLAVHRTTVITWWRELSARGAARVTV